MSEPSAHAVRPPSPTIASLGSTVGGWTNICSDGQVVPIAQKAINPPAQAQLSALARDLLNALADLGVLQGNIKELTRQLGTAWPTGAAARAATDKLFRIDGCFGALGEQAAKLQTQTDALGGTLQDTTTNLLKTLGISNAACAALMAIPFGGQAAAKATAWGTVAQIVKWLLLVKSAIVGIAEAVKAIKEMTRDIDATATAGLGAPGVPPGGQPPPPYGVPPTTNVPPGFGLPAPAWPGGTPTVYNSGAYPSGWLPEAPDGRDADRRDADRRNADDGEVSITVDKDGGVRVDASADADLTIHVNVGGKQYDFDIDPAT